MITGLKLFDIDPQTLLKYVRGKIVLSRIGSDRLTEDWKANKQKSKSATTYRMGKYCLTIVTDDALPNMIKELIIESPNQSEANIYAATELLIWVMSEIDLSLNPLLISLVLDPLIQSGGQQPVTYNGIRYGTLPGNNGGLLITIERV